MKTLLAALLVLLALSMNASLQAADGPYRHVVLFKFKDSATPEQIKKIEEEFVALKPQIPSVVSLEWGTNVSPESHAEGFTHCFFVTFKDKAGVEAYLMGVLNPIMGEKHPNVVQTLVNLPAW